MTAQKPNALENFPQALETKEKAVRQRAFPIFKRLNEMTGPYLKRFRSSQFPILIQITAPYMVLAIFIAALGTFLISRVVIDSVEERFTNQLLETGFLADEGVVRQEADLLESLRLITHIQGVDLASQSYDIQALRDLALPPAYNAEMEALVFVDSRGATLVSLALDAGTQTYRTILPEHSYAAVDFLQQVLSGAVDEQGDKFSGIVDTSGGSFLFVAGPIQDAEGRLVGAALIGKSLNSLVRELREETLGQLTIYDFSGWPLSSTLRAPRALEIGEAQVVFEQQASGSIKRALTDEGLNYNELLIPFEVRGGQDLGLMGVALPTSLVVQTSSITRNNTFILMSLLLLLVMIVGTVVARRITRPILDLKDAAVRVSEGDLKVQVATRSRDEVGVLTLSFNEMVRSLSKSKKDLLDAYDRTIEGWSRALDLRDHETEGHSQRVTELAVQLGTAMGLSADQLRDLRRGGLLHDIGKIAVPDSILLKEGKLTEAEIVLVRRHPEHAKSFMEPIEFLRPAMAVPYSHHERWDGKGYPQGLKGEQIPLLARIFAVADVWDALTSERSYRKPMSFSEALDYLRAESGKHFDPQVVSGFIKILGEMRKPKSHK